MRFYKTQHSFYAGIDLHARSMFTHSRTSSIKAARLSSSRTCPPAPALSDTPSIHSATGSSSAASACSLGTGSPTSAKTNRFLSEVRPNRRRQNRRTASRRHVPDGVRLPAAHARDARLAPTPQFFRTAEAPVDRPHHQQPPIAFPAASFLIRTGRRQISR